MSQTRLRTVCPHDCPDQCSILVTVENGRVARVSGDPDHPFTRGYLCGKVNRYVERVYSPARLHTPLRRTGPKGAGEFVPVTWTEALDEVAGRWRAIIDRHGSEALVGYAYSGNQGLVHRNLVRALFHALGGSRVLTGTVCDTASEAGWEYAVGHTPGTDPETCADSDLIVCWSADVLTTNLHLWPFIEQARAAGALLVVIDPYRSRTAAQADWHISLRPGTDTALALGIMHVLVRDNLYNAPYVAAHTVGFDRLQTEVLPHYPPERVADITGVSAADVVRLAHLYGRARAPFIRVGEGMSRCNGGGMAVRTVACLPALVGAWDQRGGGAMLMSTWAWSLDYDALRRPDLLPRPTREINQSTLGRALLELYDPPIMALFVAANNPAVTCPDQQRLVQGLSRTDLFTVVHDTFLTDTARFADLVLPACTTFESEDFFRSYGTYYASHAPQVIAPVGEARSNLWLVQELARRLGLTDPFFSRSPREHMAALLQGSTGPAAALSVQALIHTGPVKVPPARTRPAVTSLYSEAMAAAGLPPLPGWTPDPAQAETGDRWPLQLLTAPGYAQHHTAFAGVATLQEQEGPPRCLVHPTDATARGIRDGAAVTLYNDHGHVGLYARVTADTRPGLVVVAGHRNRSGYLSGGPLNVLTSDRLSDMGAGATYHSTWIDVRPCSGGTADPMPGGGHGA